MKASSTACINLKATPTCMESKRFLKLCCVSAVCWPQVVVLLNGKPITDYTFKSGVLKTT